MKRQITFLSLLVVVTTMLFSCKKDETSLKARMMGKWNISKIEVSGYTVADLAGDPKKVNGTITGLSGDYMDFKSNNDDQVELNIKGDRSIGTYISTGEAFNMSFSEGDFYCTVNSLTEKQFQFTAKLDKTNVVKVYYLTR
ncbi:hypothetical protein [Pedobacter chinensis]|nr:hypothetical protein [Pedobacter chinensis]